MTTYFGFALSSSMFNGNCTIDREVLALNEAVKAEIEFAVNCCNSTHATTVEAAEKKFGLSLVIPDEPPTVSLNSGDSLIVMGVRGLSRLTDRHHYTAEEVERATFEFVRYSVR